MIAAVGEPYGLDRDLATLCGILLRLNRTTDIADELVAAEALLWVPSIVITSDPVDIRRLLEQDPRGTRVVVWSV